MLKEEMEKEIKELKKMLNWMIDDFKELVDHYNDHEHYVGEVTAGEELTIPSITEWKRRNGFEVDSDIKKL